MSMLKVKGMIRQCGESALSAVVLIACFSGLWVGPAGAAPSASSERTYEFTEISFRYVHELGALPSSEDLRENVRVELAQVDGVYTAPTDDHPGQAMRLNELVTDESAVISASGLRRIAREVADYFSAPPRGLNVFVATDPNFVDPLTGRDRRPRDETRLRMKIEYTGPTHEISDFRLEYAFPEVQGQPDLSEIKRAVTVDLIETESFGYVVWRPGREPVRLSLSDIADRGPLRLSAAAVQEVLQQTRDYLIDRGYIGIFVTPDQQALEDALRGPAAVDLIIVTGVVTEMRTLASGDRLPDGPERINHPKHDRIRERSPIQPMAEGQDLLRRQTLDDYVYRLSRHPGRRVDVGIAPAERELTYSLDYIVTEARPLLLYAQVANTGTPQTNRWQQRFGLFHTQLTNNDDILTVDYLTAGFEDVHTITASYEAPLFGSDRLRWKIMGNYGEFTASDVGFPQLEFTGRNWGVGGEVIWNFFQREQYFLDLVAGLRYSNVKVENFFTGFAFNRGQQDFLIPYAGLRSEKVTNESTFRFSGIFEWNIPGATSVDRDEIERLGRIDPDREWAVFRWDLLQTFYLEPIVNRDAWEDVSSPETSTLAHELALGFRGQYAFNNRLIPQEEMVAGGMYTVRGYPESVTAGDTVLIGTGEYRFHLPRIFGPEMEPGELFGQPFRWAPQYTYGQTDWDLILRGFVDVARVLNTDRQAFEQNDTLVGAGIGLEFQYKRNVNLRLDWGHALKSVDNRVDSGSNRVHFAATLVF